MLSSGQLEDDVFLDSMDHLSSDESVISEEELESRGLEYEIWMKEPQSVKERRRSFFETMNLVDFTSKDEPELLLKSPENVGLNRISNCSMSISGSDASSCDRTRTICTDLSEQNQDNRSASDLEDKPMQLHTHKGSYWRETQANVGSCESSKSPKKTWRTLLKRLSSIKKREYAFKIETSKQNIEAPKFKVRSNKKSFQEFSALCPVQEIQAHNGSIWAMKFNPDNKYLATGGEDGVVCIWRVTSTAASCEYFDVEGGCMSSLTGEIGSNQASILIPNMVFQLEESPVHEFHEHTADVLDLAWSNSNCLLSASIDRTVRLWQLGCNQCVHVFHHRDYVTCIQFNPADDSCFISGSIDGKVRVWGVSQRRVIDWVDVRDIITAICYNPDGKGFVVGSITGKCHFYEPSGNNLQLTARINIQAKKKTSRNKVTGIQFSQENSQRVMITSEDSKIRICDGFRVLYKYKGLSNFGTRSSASFTSSGKHIISVGDNSCVSIWNYDDSSFLSSTHPKSVRSCEYFYSEGASVAVSWSGIMTDKRKLHASLRDKMHMQDKAKAAAWVKDTGQFSFSSWLLLDGTCRGSSTWPEEKLPLWGMPLEKKGCYWLNLADHLQQKNSDRYNTTSFSEVCGLVILTAGIDGKIRTFQDSGLPVSL